MVADDQELLRSGFAMILDAQPDIEVVGEAGNGRRRWTWPCAGAGRGPDGRAHAGDGRYRGRAPGDLPSGGARVLMLTTFDLDEYVYDALHGRGAAGFLLKDVRRDDLVHAVRVVAAATRCWRRP